MGICGHNGLRKMGCDLSGYCGSTVAAHDDADTVPGAHLPVGAYIAEKGVLFLGREHLHRVVVLTKVVFFRYGVKVDGIIMHMGPGIHIPGGIADDRIIFPYGALPQEIAREAILWPMGISVFTVMPSSGIKVPAAMG